MAAIIGILLIGQFVLRPLLHLVVKTGSRDLIMAITLLLIVGAAGAAGIAGLSTAFGAFLAGLLLSESEYKHQIEIDLEPFKGLLLGLFFMTVGMLLDPLVLLAHAHLIIAGLVLLLIVKAVGFFCATRVFAWRSRSRPSSRCCWCRPASSPWSPSTWRAAVGALTEEVAQVAIGIVVLSMVATPLLGILAPAVGRTARRHGHGGQARSTGESHRPRDHQRLSPRRPGDRGDARGRARALRTFDTGGAVRQHHRPTAGVLGDISRRTLLHRAGADMHCAFLVTVTPPRGRTDGAAILRRPDARCSRARP